MCFSATASFSASAVLALAGVAAVKRVRSPREYLLTSFPFVFSLQQFCEGMIWREFAQCASVPAPTSQGIWVMIFLIFATAVWPLFAPLAALLLETQTLRRRALQLTCLFGAVVFANSTWKILYDGASAAPDLGGINYSATALYSLSTRLFYVPAVCSLCLSSYPWIAIFGFGILASNIWADEIFYQSSASVWCFFAAVLSAAVVMHFYSNKSPTNSDEL